MNSPPLTTVELLQQQRYPQTTTTSLKRSAQQLQYTSSEEIRNSRPYPLQTIQSNAIQSKRHISGTTIAVSRGENDPGNLPRPRPSAAYPTPPPSTLRNSTEAAEGVCAKLEQSSPIRECNLCHPKWELPRSVIEAYAVKGVTSLYEWQKECLSIDGVLSEQKNLIYTAPTSAGKTMVAELLVIKQAILKKKKCIIVLPFVSIVTEKTKHFKSLLAKADVEVASFHGGARSVDIWDIAICTIEKANSLINSMLDDNTIVELGALVLDEMHMVGDPHRGYIMELLVTKVLAIQLPIQIIGMSATMKNVEVLGKWIDGSYYNCEYRPIPLCEYIVSNNSITTPEKQPVRQMTVLPHPKMGDALLNSVVTLTLETIQEGNSVLIFCSSRMMTVDTAKMIASFIREPADRERRLALIQRLRNAPAGLDEMLERPILKGVAYHHAGLTTEERELIEEAYDTGVLKATATLAAGINLPSRRVIFRGPRMGRDILSVASYRQMKGRAGRKGKDTHGESFLCYSKNDEKSVVEMITGEMPEIASCLGRENKGFERALLEAVAANLATSQTAINTYASWTLFYHQAEYFLGIAQADNSDTENVRQIMKNAANYLIENGLVEAITEGFTQAGGGLKATILGKAIVSSALSIDEGLFVHRELDRSMRSFILDDELHLIYHCTPVYAQCEVDYKALRNKIDGLSESSILVATTIGVSPALINRLAQGAVLNDDTLENQEKLRIHRRFWISLMLQQLIKEEPLSKVAESFGVERGFLQSLCSTTTGFAGMVQVFCSKLGWGNLALLLGGFKERLMFGVRAELLELAKLPYVKGFTARIFLEAGLKTIGLVAESSIEDIVTLLVKARSSSRRKKMDDADAELQMRIDFRSAKIILKAAKRLRDQEREIYLED